MADMVQIETTDTYKDWYLDLEKKEAAAVDRKVKMLQLLGLSLPFPHSSDIKGAKYPFRELRVNNPPIRVLYAFDPARKAVLIIGGDKTSDNRFYERLIPKAELLWEGYLAQLPPVSPPGPRGR
jgi:hypothetical protein